MDRIVNRILGMIVQLDLCGSRLISYHPPPLSPIECEKRRGGDLTLVVLGRRRSGATGVMLSGGDSLRVSRFHPICHPAAVEVILKEKTKNIFPCFYQTFFFFL